MDSVSLATGGLFLSWLVHDLEEPATMPGWTHPAMDRIPLLPEDVRRNGVSREQVNLGIGAMGVLMAAALVEGYRIRKVTLTRCQGHFIMRACSRVLSIPRRVSVEPFPWYCSCAPDALLDPAISP